MFGGTKRTCIVASSGQCFKFHRLDDGGDSSATPNVSTNPVTPRLPFAAIDILQGSESHEEHEAHF